LAENKGAPPDYILATLLSAAASLVGNARRFKAWDGWEEACAIWTCLVGGPSAGKSPSAEPVLEVLRAIERSRLSEFSQKLRQHEADVEAAKIAVEEWRSQIERARREGERPPLKPGDAMQPETPSRPRAYVMDVTTEQLAMILADNPKGCLQFRDEISGFLAGHGRYGNDTDRPFYLESYGGRPFSVDRKKNPEPILIPRLTLSVCGGIQPDRLNSLLLRGEDDGLSSRFIYFWPDSLRPVMPSGLYDVQSLKRLFSRLERLQLQETEDGPEPFVMAMENPSMLDGWRQRLFDQEPDVSGIYGSFIGKQSGVAVRLAGLIELLDWAIGEGEQAPLIISSSALTRALRFIDEYSIPMARRVFADAAVPEIERKAAALAREIRKRRISKFNAREARLMWGVPGLRDAVQMDAALAILEEAGWVRLNASRQGESKGRKSKNYEVNPALH